MTGSSVRRKTYPMVRKKPKGAQAKRPKRFIETKRELGLHKGEGSQGPTSKKLTLARCTPEYWEFVRRLRTDRRTSPGFIRQGKITPAQQKKHMKKHWQNHFIALLGNQPVGYVGSVDGDIRVCTHPDYQHRGVARFMVEELMKRYRTSFAKIKIGNDASKRLFESCGFTLTFLIYEKLPANRR